MMLGEVETANKNNCPIFRSPAAILNAGGSNLGLDTMALMKTLSSLKENIREWEQGRFDEIVGKQPGGKTSKDECEIATLEDYHNSGK